jgi:hypothetical protein
MYIYAYIYHHKVALFEIFKNLVHTQISSHIFMLNLLNQESILFVLLFIFKRQIKISDEIRYQMSE